MITDGSTDIYFFALRGVGAGLVRLIGEEDRPGEDGSARRILGLKPKLFRLLAECHVDSVPLGRYLGLLLQSWTGFVVDFVQDDVDNFNCLVRHVDVGEPEAAANIRRGVYPADGTIKNGAGAIVTAVFDMEYTANA